MTRSAPRRRDGAARPAEQVAPPAPRDPVNAVFDAACALVDAARSLREAAQRPNAAGAAPAVLGCLEEAEQQLAAAAAELRREADAMLATGRACAPPPRADRHARMQTGFANLEVALGDAAAAASAARSLTARALHGARGRGA